METFLGKSAVCDMTVESGALDKSIFNGNTILLKISEESNRHRYVFIGCKMICSFLTDDNNYKCISNMGKSLTPYSIAIGMQKIFFNSAFSIY